jgi:hypothetical protein
MNGPRSRRMGLMLLAALMSMPIGTSAVLAGTPVSTNRITVQPTLVQPMPKARSPHLSAREGDGGEPYPHFCCIACICLPRGATTAAPVRH